MRLSFIGLVVLIPKEGNLYILHLWLYAKITAYKRECEVLQFCCIEIINTVRREVNIPALLDTSGFGSRRGPYNCKKCNKDLKHMIIDCNLTQSIIEYDCECKSEWLAEVKNADMNQSTVKIKHIALY